MPLAIDNDRDKHIDLAKQTVFALFEAIRRRQPGEVELIKISLRRLGAEVKFREPQLIDDPSSTRKALRY